MCVAMVGGSANGVLGGAAVMAAGAAVSSVIVAATVVSDGPAGRGSAAGVCVRVSGVEVVRGERRAIVRAPVLKWGDGGYIFGNRSDGATERSGGRSDGGSEKAEADAVGEKAVGEFRRANGREVLTAFPGADSPQMLELTAATRDPADRAHLVFVDGKSKFGTERMLGAGRDVDPGRSRPRRYPPSQMTSRGVGFDSAFDELYQRECRLGALGVAGIGRKRVREEYGGGGESSTSSISAVSFERAREYAARMGTSVRKLVERNASASGATLKSAESVLEAYRRGKWKAEE